VRQKRKNLLSKISQNSHFEVSHFAVLPQADAAENFNVGLDAQSTCVGDIGWWMCANRLKLKQDNTQFI